MTTAASPEPTEPSSPSLENVAKGTSSDADRSSPARMERLLGIIERSQPIARWGDTIEPLVRRAIGRGSRQDLLTGRWLGHPAHPAAVIVPMTCWFGSSLLDVVGGHRSADASRRLVGLGVLTVAPVAAAGAADWLDTSGAERRVGTLHALLNNVASALFATSWLLRRRGLRRTGIGFGMAGTATTAGAAFLGGHLTYRRGVGVNTTAFQSGPQEWHEVTLDCAPGAGEVVRGVADGAVLAVARDRNDRLHVMETRCTHRGGPLHEGELHDGCVVCPWHTSEFDLATGAVRRGPATVPQPVYEYRIEDGRLEVRRDEAGGLRSNIES